MGETNTKLNIVLDATMLDTFDACPAKLNYRFNLNKVTQVKAKPLDRGTLVHLGLEEYYSELQRSHNWDTAMNAMKMAIMAGSLESDLETTEINRCYEVLTEHCNVWKYRDLEFDIIEVEKSFAYLLHEDEFMKIVMIGKIDLLVNWKTYTNLPIDHKTYERDFPVKRLTNQFCNYTVATSSDYLFVNRIGFQKSISPEVKHKFVPLSYDPIFHEQWKKNTIEIVKYYAECAVNNSWPMRLTSCDKFGRLCEYHEVCDSSGLESKQFKLDVNFASAEKWDVSAALGKTHAKSE